MARLRQGFQRGTTTDNPLSAAGTVITSPAFASLVAVGGGDYMTLVLDPEGTFGAPEIVQVTAHGAASTSVTVVRGGGITTPAGDTGTASRQHPTGTVWRHGPTTADFDDVGTFDGVRALFRANRRLVAEYSAQENMPIGALLSDVGVGFLQSRADGSDSVVSLGGEPVMKFSVAIGSTCVPVQFIPLGVAGAQPTAARASLTPGRVSEPVIFAGGVLGLRQRDSERRLPPHPHDWRRGIRHTTGQPGDRYQPGRAIADRGARYEVESPDAGVTWVCRDQAGAVLATHTTNVPAATAALSYGVVTATMAAVPWGVAYARVEGTFA